MPCNVAQTAGAIANPSREGPEDEEPVRPGKRRC